MSHSPLARNGYIDGLRALAICSVLILHFALSYGLKQSPLGLLPAGVVRALGQHGNYGVTIFFTISGFLITSNVLQRWGSLDRIDLRSFYALRAARILPPLLTALAVIVVLGCLGLPSFDNTDGDHVSPATPFVLGVGSVLTFSHNVLMQSEGYFNYCLNVYWSLSVEEMFYLLMPLCCLLLRRQWLFVLGCLVVIGAGPFYRAAHADNEIYYMYGYLACFDAIAIGCLAALLTRRVTLAAAPSRVLRWGALLVMGAVYLRGFSGAEAWGFTAMALATAAFLLGASPVGAATGGRRWSAPWRWLGRNSYELYLYHIIVLAALRDTVEKAQLDYATRLPLLVLFVALSCAMAALVARYVSEPANRSLRRRWLRAPAVHPGAAAMTR